MSDTANYVLKECVVVGAGISGLGMARWLKGYNIDSIVIERTDDIGGLWRYRENDYGVMAFTHINVSKYNYCYSDHPFPKDTPDYPHHTEMYNYVKSYADRFELFDVIRFNTVVVSIDELGKNEDLYKKMPTFNSVKFYEKLWRVMVRDLKTENTTQYITPYVSICSGHHATPIYADFPGQDTFPGRIVHSVKFKSATVNEMSNQRVLVVGIGNSAVDVAVNLHNEGRCKKVVISSRSGAWIVPNYVQGFATDLYACRVFLSFHWKVASVIFENVVKFIYGDPKKYNLNPKMRIMQSQPTVSPTLIHHIQRKNIHLVPNIKRITGSDVTFENDLTEKFDVIILCTGYKINLNYLSEDVKRQMFIDRDETVLNLYKNVFNPKIGRSLSLIGFAQPTSGGLLTMAEMQARWHVQLMTNKIKLPAEDEMVREIKRDQVKNDKRFHNSKRHTIQRDPILYNDEIGSFFDAKPSLYQNFWLLARLLFSSCGPAQYRLNGPDAIPEARSIIQTVPMTDMMKLVGILLFILLGLLALWGLSNPFYLIILGASFFFYRKIVSNRADLKNN